MVRFRKRQRMFGFTRDANYGVLSESHVTNHSTPDLHPSCDFLAVKLHYVVQLFRSSDPDTDVFALEIH